VVQNIQISSGIYILLKMARNRNWFSNQLRASQAFVSGPCFSIQEMLDHRNPAQPFPYASWKGRPTGWLFSL